MAAVWQRERADGIWIWNARWMLEACALALTTYRRSAAERRRGGRWRGEDPQVCVRNMRIRIVKVGALEIRFFECIIPALMANFLGSL
jgi:hypothetical protein